VAAPVVGVLLLRVRRVVTAAMPYLLVTVIVGALVWWYAHPRQPPSTRLQRTHSPAHLTRDSVPVGATARCGDGTYSFSEHRAGACSHHGGVAAWLNH